MSLSVGLQLFTLRNEMEQDFEGTLREVKVLGYAGVEFAGLFGREGSEIKALLDEIGLVAVSAHVPLSELRENGENLFRTYSDIGIKYMAIPYLAESDRPEGGHFEKTLKDIEEICKGAKAFGITMLYHNHDFEFNKVDGEYYLDTIYKTIPADLLQTEIDTCWVNVAGEEPAAYVRKYTGRAPIVHFKDFVMEGKAGKEDLYELIGMDKKVEGDEGAFAFRPLGYGAQNFPEIIAASEEAGAKWVIVEQDRPAAGQSPLESVKLSRAYLKSLGL